MMCGDPRLLMIELALKSSTSRVAGQFQGRRELGVSLGDMNHLLVFQYIALDHGWNVADPPKELSSFTPKEFAKLEVPNHNQLKLMSLMAFGPTRDNKNSYKLKKLQAKPNVDVKDLRKY